MLRRRRTRRKSRRRRWPLLSANRKKQYGRRAGGSRASFFFPTGSEREGEGVFLDQTVAAIGCRGEGGFPGLPAAFCACGTCSGSCPALVWLLTACSTVPALLCLFCLFCLLCLCLCLCHSSSWFRGGRSYSRRIAANQRPAVSLFASVLWPQCRHRLHRRHIRNENTQAADGWPIRARPSLAAVVSWRCSLLLLHDTTLPAMTTSRVKSLPRPCALPCPVLQKRLSLLALHSPIFCLAIFDHLDPPGPRLHTVISPLLFPFPLLLLTLPSHFPSAARAPAPAPTPTPTPNANYANSPTRSLFPFFFSFCGSAQIPWNIPFPSPSSLLPPGPVSRARNKLSTKKGIFPLARIMLCGDGLLFRPRHLCNRLVSNLQSPRTHFPISLAPLPNAGMRFYCSSNWNRNSLISLPSSNFPPSPQPFAIFEENGPVVLST